MNHLLSIDLIVLFFFLGALASWVRSDLEIPEPVSKFLSIFLLLSLGLKGGHEVRTAESLSGFGWTIGLGLSSCLVIPFYLFHCLKRKLGPGNAASIAASYGSVSAVTLIAAQGLLANENISSSGYMVAVMALMEIPAIVVALSLYRRASDSARAVSGGSSIFAAKSVVLLLGGFVIGLAMNETSWSSLAPVVKDSFKGFLVFFLLDLGVAAQRELRRAWEFKILALVIACLLPLCHGAVVLSMAKFAGIQAGDAIILAVLVGSASYIAAPAAIRAAIPSANPSLYVALPLALTFPMNVIFGIPFYIEFSRYLFI